MNRSVYIFRKTLSAVGNTSASITAGPLSDFEWPIDSVFPPVFPLLLSRVLALSLGWLAVHDDAALLSRVHQVVSIHNYFFLLSHLYNTVLFRPKVLICHHLQL
jgi:hypothetical protein